MKATTLLKKNLLTWYGNEMGYTHALMLHVIKAGQTPVTDKGIETPGYN